MFFSTVAMEAIDTYRLNKSIKRRNGFKNDIDSTEVECVVRNVIFTAHEAESNLYPIAIEPVFWRQVQRPASPAMGMGGVNNVLAEKRSARSKPGKRFVIVEPACQIFRLRTSSAEPVRHNGKCGRFG